MIDIFAFIDKGEIYVLIMLTGIANAIGTIVGQSIVSATKKIYKLTHQKIKKTK